jgi:hypothetical protein
MEKVHTCALSGPHEWNLASRLPYLVFLDNPIPVLYQRDQRVEHLRRERDTLIVLPQFPHRGIEPEGTKDVDLTFVLRRRIRRLTLILHSATKLCCGVWAWNQETSTTGSPSL